MNELSVWNNHRGELLTTNKLVQCFKIVKERTLRSENLITMRPEKQTKMCRNTQMPRNTHDLSSVVGKHFVFIVVDETNS